MSCANAGRRRLPGRWHDRLSGWWRHRWLPGVLLLLTSGCVIPASNDPAPDPAFDRALVQALRQVALPLGPMRDGEVAELAELAPLIERLAPARLVLLGEASHGTAEFYTLRAAISRALVAEHGFRFIAVEGDWNALYRLNRYVKGRDPDAGSARAIMQGFNRWPTWLWANEEAAAFIEWLKTFNADRPAAERVGFYGIDVYGNEDALRELPLALEALDPEQAAWLRAQYAPLTPMFEDFRAWLRTLPPGAPDLGENTRAVVERLRDARDDLAVDADEYLHLKQMAWVVKNAERHYSGMADAGPDSWNARVEHFYQTMARLLEYYGPDARGIVWAHNTHIGDARATDMARAQRTNIGQLAREALGIGQVAAVGFGTDRGTVLAGRAWEAPMSRMTIPRAVDGSIEAAMQAAGPGNLLFLFDADTPQPLYQRIGHRAIGVVYRPEREVPGNYVPTVIPQRYDAFIFIEETTALTPLAGS